MVYDLKLESEEDGFHLVLETDGEFDVDVAACRFGFRLSSRAARALFEQGRDVIGPWVSEGEAVKADFDRCQRTGEVPDYVPEYGGDDADVHPVSDEERAEALREQADLERKRQKENPEGWLGEHLAEARAVEQHQEEKHGD